MDTDSVIYDCSGSPQEPEICVVENKSPKKATGMPPTNVTRVQIIWHDLCVM